MGDAEDVMVRSGITLTSFLDRLGLEDPESRAFVRAAFILGVGVKSVASPTECLRWVAAYRNGERDFQAFCDYLEVWLVALDREELELAAHCVLSGHPELEPEPEPRSCDSGVAS